MSDKQTPGEMVRDFHIAYGLPVLDEFRELTPDRLRLRLRLIREEYNEVLDAVDDHDLVNLVKELNDLIYVATGMLLEMGADPDATFAEVHHSNMSKLGEDGRPLYRGDGKVMKGPHYAPVDLRKVLVSPQL